MSTNAIAWLLCLCVVKMDRAMAVRMMKFAVRDLRQVEQLEPSWAATADCCSLYLRCQMLLCKALDIHSGAAVSLVRSQQTDVQRLRLQVGWLFVKMFIRFDHN